MSLSWTPPEWVYNCFPAPAEAEEVSLTFVLEAMEAELDLCTEHDSGPRARALHVAHMLVSHQGSDGLWPADLNLRTGEPIGAQRSGAPLPLFRRLNAALDSSEFDFAIRRAEAGLGLKDR